MTRSVRGHFAKAGTALRWVAAALLAWLLGPGSAIAGPITLTQAEFRSTPEAAWQDVALPDTWAARGLSPGVGRYRLALHLTVAPTEVWALRGERISTDHELWVNGVHLHGELGRQDGLRRPVPTLVTIPPHLLREGRNLIELGLHTGPRAGLSPIDIGPEAELTAGHAWNHQRHVSLPQLLNAAGAGVALFMVALWTMRRSEAALGSFGALALLASVRNLSYFPLGSAMALPHGESLFFLAQVASVQLLGTFAQGFSGRRLDKYRRTLRASTLLLSVAALVAGATAQTHLLRTVAYPWLLLLALPALYLIAVRRQLRNHGTADRLLPLTLGLVLLAGAHDYAYQQGHTSIMDTYWLPFAVPVAIAAFSLLLMRRLVTAMQRGERMNLTLERRVIERTRELQAANAAKTRFLAAASHDLRQPMATIGLLTGLLREQPLAGGVRRLVERLEDASRAMDSLLRRLLDLSRLESGTVQARRQPVALQALFDTVASHCDELAAHKGLRLTMHPTDAVVDSDPVLLEQVLGNLVGNAVRCTTHGGVLVGVRRAGPDRVRLQVWDSGPGIPQDARAAVFEEFVQLDATGRVGGAQAEPARHGHSRGVGLGLSIVKRSLALLDAPLQLRSEPGRGSCFSIVLPRTRPVPAAAVSATWPTASPRSPSITMPSTRTTTEPADPPRPLAGLRVWHLEDHVAAREALQLRLESWGAQVQGFADVGSWRAAIARGIPADLALLLCDRGLPDGDGLDAVRSVHDLRPDLPALILTGDTAPTDFQALAHSGIPVLHKPFSAEELHDALAHVLGRRATAPV